MTVLSDNLSV